jgi:hypothetical protein
MNENNRIQIVDFRMENARNTLKEVTILMTMNCGIQQ